MKCRLSIFKLLLVWKMIVTGNHFEEPPLNIHFFVCEMRFFAIFGDFPSLESHNKFSYRRAASLTAAAVTAPKAAVFSFSAKKPQIASCKQNRFVV